MTPALYRALALATLTFKAVASPALKARGERPLYFTDPSTTTSCTWYHDNADNSVACADVPSLYGITMDDFLKWNPIVTNTCSGYSAFQSYCVEAFGEPTPTSNSPTPPTSSPGNGITTPQPTQPGMVGNCNKFYFVQKDQGCTEIASLNGITFQQLLAWNAGVGSNCEGLWANVNVCVGLIGSTPRPTLSQSSSQPPTTPTPTNGVQTPVPTQPGMVSNCDRFYFVKSGDGCQAIADQHGIALSDFVKWNPGVGSNCSGMWANAYVCVRVIGYTPPTPTTRPPTSTIGNGVTTPTPTQIGMVGNCNRFYFVKQGDTCDSIVSAHRITLANFIRWNPAAKSDCTGLWANTYACVGTL